MKILRKIRKAYVELELDESFLVNAVIAVLTLGLMVVMLAIA